MALRNEPAGWFENDPLAADSHAGWENAPHGIEHDARHVANGFKVRLGQRISIAHSGEPQSPASVAELNCDELTERDSGEQNPTWGWHPLAKMTRIRRLRSAAPF